MIHSNTIVVALLSIVVFTFSVRNGREIFELVGDYRKISEEALNLTGLLLFQYAINEYATSAHIREYRELTEKFIETKVKPLLRMLEANGVEKTDEHYVAIKEVMDSMEVLYHIKKYYYMKSLIRVHEARGKIRVMGECFERYEEPEKYPEDNETEVITPRTL
uniref:Uncharacterized protein n=1 Tax=Clastoptera arizonana TaxID=38151 RepID=A0A1B6E1J4_9HEMI